MIWLASFPRSGNTFFRNVLYEVYGIESSTFHRDGKRKVDKNFHTYPVVKTHELPALLPVKYRDMPSVYIVRDGRDSLVSIAHHRKDIVVPGSDFECNLIEAILAQKGSFFGGWSENVQQWTEKADIVIRFEDLVSDPIGEIEKLRAIMDLPQPDPEKLPDFKALKFGNPKYGGGKGRKFKKARAQLHFRKGKVGGWKDELPPRLETLLWRIHGPTLSKMGFEASQLPKANLTRRKVLIEASKLYSYDNDGVKRYLTELVNAYSIILQHLPEWQIELFDQKSVQPILKNQAQEIEDKTNPEFVKLGEKEAILKDRRTMGYEKQLLLAKSYVKNAIPKSLYIKLSDYYRRGPFRSFLTSVKLKANRLKYQKTQDDIAQSVADADLVHVPLPQHLHEVGEVKGELLVTIHDLTHELYPDYHTQHNIKLAEAGTKAMLERAAKFIAVSESTKSDLISQYQLPEDRIFKVHEAVKLSVFNPNKGKENIEWLRKKYNIPGGEFVMCLSTIEPRKNLKNTLKAFVAMKKEHPELDIKLVVCGKKGWKTDTIFDDVDLEGQEVYFTGFVDDMHLPYLYAHAKLLCYVSHYEGFGLPLLEAMACKTPVLYGDNSSMPEVGGEGGLAADSNDVADIKNKMYRLLSDEELWTEKSDAAFRQASKQTWLKVAMETLEVYDQLIKSS